MKREKKKKKTYLAQGLFYTLHLIASPHFPSCFINISGFFFFFFFDSIIKIEIGRQIIISVSLSIQQD